MQRFSRSTEPIRASGSRIHFTLVSGLIAATLTPQALLAQADEENRLERRLLDNGLEVVVVRNHASPLATVLVAVKTGAFTQQPGEEGLAHLYEHLLFRSYGDDAKFAGEATKLNASYNGTTSEEVVTYFLTLPSENTKNGIRLLADLVKKARFKDDHVEEEMPVVLDELERGQSDPERSLVRRVARRLWGADWYRKDTGGDSASLAGITPDQLNRTYQRFYLPNNAALIVTGDVSAAEVFEEAERRFRDWEPGPDPFSGVERAPIAPLGGTSAVAVGENVADVTIRIEMHGPSLARDPEATYAADVLFQILNNPTSSFQERLVERGPFLSVSCWYLTLEAAGPIVITGRIEPDDAETGIMALVGELDEMKDFMDLTEENLAIAKKLRTLDAALAFEETATLAPSLASWWSSGGLDYQLTYGSRMNAQTLEDLERFAGEYIANRPKVIGILGLPTVIARVANWMQGARE